MTKEIIYNVNDISLSVVPICLLCFFLQNSLLTIFLIIFIQRNAVLLSVVFDVATDVPRTLTNDLWVFLLQTINAECVK